MSATLIKGLKGFRIWYSDSEQTNYLQPDGSWKSFKKPIGRFTSATGEDQRPHFPTVFEALLALRNQMEVRVSKLNPEEYDCELDVFLAQVKIAEMELR